MISTWQRMMGETMIFYKTYYEQKWRPNQYQLKREQTNYYFTWENDEKGKKKSDSM